MTYINFKKTNWVCFLLGSLAIDVQAARTDAGKELEELLLNADKSQRFAPLGDCEFLSASYPYGHDTIEVSLIGTRNFYVDISGGSTSKEELSPEIVIYRHEMKDGGVGFSLWPPIPNPWSHASRSHFYFDGEKLIGVDLEGWQWVGIGGEEEKLSSRCRNVDYDFESLLK